VCTSAPGLIYAVGGKDNTTLNTAECYNIATATWSTLSPMSMCRKFPGAECISRRIFVMGGIDAANARLRSVEEYIPSLDQWVSICPMLWSSPIWPWVGIVWALQLWVWSQILGRHLSCTGWVGLYCGPALQEVLLDVTLQLFNLMSNPTRMNHVDFFVFHSGSENFYVYVIFF